MILWIAAALAAICPLPLDQAVADAINNAGWELTAVNDVTGDPDFDQIVKFMTPNGPVSGLALRGCMVTPPFDLTLPPGLRSGA